MENQRRKDKERDGDGDGEGEGESKEGHHSGKGLAGTTLHVRTSCASLLFSNQLTSDTQGGASSIRSNNNYVDFLRYHILYKNGDDKQNIKYKNFTSFYLPPAV